MAHEQRRIGGGGRRALGVFTKGGGDAVWGPLEVLLETTLCRTELSRG